MSDSSTTLWTVAHQVPLSMGFSRQEHQSGLPFPSPGDLPNPGIKPTSPALVDEFFTIEPPGKPTHSNKLRITTISSPPFKVQHWLILSSGHRCHPYHHQIYDDSSHCILLETWISNSKLLPSHSISHHPLHCHKLSYWLAWFFSDSLPQKGRVLNHLGHCL